MSSAATNGRTPSAYTPAEPVGELARRFTWVRRIGATKPPRLPSELIRPIPAAAAVPVRNAVGYDHVIGPTARKLETARVMKTRPMTGRWLVPAHADPKMHSPVETNSQTPRLRRRVIVVALRPMK